MPSSTSTSFTVSRLFGADWERRSETRLLRNLLGAIAARTGVSTPLIRMESDEVQGRKVKSTKVASASYVCRWAAAFSLKARKGKEFKGQEDEKIQ